MVSKIKKKWQKSSKMFVCEVCDYTTSRKSSYEKHLESKKHKEQKLQSKNETFRCICCDYTTSKKYNYDKHLLTKRHKDTLQLFSFPNVSKNEKKWQKSCKNEFICEFCDKKYTNRAGLWKHKKKCKNAKKDNVGGNWTPSDIEKILKLAGTTNNTTNNTTINNTTNISINVYLNEYCKDALNLTDFVKKIQLSVEDVIKTNNLGLEDGVSNVVIKELKDLSANQRPIHCVDVKRNKFYIKDNDEWKKEDAEKIIKAAEKIRVQHIKVLEEWENDHPNYLTLGHKDHEMWQRMVATFTKKITDKDKGKILSAIKRRVMIKEAMVEI